MGDVFTPTTITSDEWSYQYWPGSPEDERLYHLPSDPGQEHDVLPSQREVARDLRAAYLGWMSDQNPQMAEWMVAAERDPSFRIASPAFPRIG